MIRLTLTQPNPSPEATRYVKVLEAALNYEAEERAFNLSVYGTTHPETLPDGFLVRPYRRGFRRRSDRAA